MMLQNHFMLALQRAGSIQSQKANNKQRGEEQREENGSNSKQETPATNKRVTYRGWLQATLRHVSRCKGIWNMRLFSSFSAARLSPFPAPPTAAISWSEWFKCHGNRTDNWQQATGQRPLACIRIRYYDALTFWNIVAWLDYSQRGLTLLWLCFSFSVLCALLSLQLQQTESPLSSLYCRLHYDRFAWKLHLVFQLLFSYFFHSILCSLLVSHLSCSSAASLIYHLGPSTGSSLKSHSSVRTIKLWPKFWLLVSIFCRNLSTKFSQVFINIMSSLSKNLSKSFQHLSVNCHKNVTS